LIDAAEGCTWFMNATAYIRVSSRAQDHGSQKAAIERTATARGDVVGVWYAEKMSAKTLGRPELQRLRADARAGLVQRLYLFRVDRLARSGIRDTFEVIEELRGHGVEIVTVADGLPRRWARYRTTSSAPGASS
jgi:DNA invertase Pin-like site-specific DNA recombinase